MLSSGQVVTPFLVLVCLQVLETSVKNCGLRFHIKVAQKDFLNDMLKVINPKVSLKCDHDT